MSFSATITIPSTPTLARILSTEDRKDARSETTISSFEDTITITIKATDFPSLRASANTVMQTIATHNNMIGA